MSSNKIKKKHVLLVIRHPVGGIRTYLKYVYKYNNFSNYRFTIVLPSNNLTENCLGTDNKLECKLVECENRISSLLICLIKTMKNNQIDLLHSHGFTSGACVALLAKLFSTPHLMTAHDVILEKQFSGSKGGLKKRVISFLFNRIDLIQSVTNDAQNNFAQMLPAVTRPEKEMILNGIDISLYNDPGKRDFRVELGLSDNIFLIGFLGRFMSQKGFKYLVEALENIHAQTGLSRKPVLLVFSSDGFIREEKEIISLKKLDDVIRFLPPVDNVSAVINGLDIVAMPSLWEACGLLAMETLISGKPLIASNCIGLREVIEDSPTFIVKPGDTQSLADAIMASMEDDRSADFMSYSKVAKDRFTSETTATKLSKIYSRMLD